MTSLTKKKIEVTLQLQNNKTFNDNGNNTLKLSGFRCEVDIRKIGMMGAESQARVKIYGMLLADMNKLTTMNWDSVNQSKNLIAITAGDGVNMADVWQGNIMQAWADFSGMPESCLTIDTSFGYFNQINPAQATATQTATPVADMMKDLATKMGYGFENNGVTATLSAMTLKGSYIDQARTVANASQIFWTIENNTLIIAPKNVSIHKGQIPLINAQTGLLGYPAMSANGISFTTLFNPALQANGKIKLECGIEPCEGEWVVTSLEYRLESEKPNGAWYCQVEAVRSNQAVGVISDTQGEANNG